MSHEFYIGQKIVCVRDQYWPRDGEICPQKNCVYSVRAVAQRFSVGHGLFMDVLWLNEIINAPRPYFGQDFPYECPWRYEDFRPLESKSISLFRAIAQGVTDGRPIVPDKMPAIEIEAAAWPVDIHIIEYREF